MLQVLLIDDERSIFESVKLFLEKQEESEDPFAFLDEEDEEEVGSEEEGDLILCKVHWAETGKQGLERVQQAEPDFDLILVDKNMPPGWNGIQTIEQIRKLNSEIPIALVTANMSTDPSIQNMLTQQRVQLFHKPYGREQLLGLVNEMSAG